MRKEYTDFTPNERRMKHITPAQIVSKEDSVCRLMFNDPGTGSKMIMPMTISFAEMIGVLEYVDLEPYLNGSVVGYRLAGMTPPEYQPKN